MNYITYSYTEVMRQVLVNTALQHPELADIEKFVEIGETVLQYCQPKDESPESIAETKTMHDNALEGIYGEEVRDRIKKFEEYIMVFSSIQKSFNMAFVSYLQVLPDNKFRYVLSGDFGYRWLRPLGLTDLLYPEYSAEELSNDIVDAVKHGEFKMSGETVDTVSEWGAIVPGYLPIKNSSGVVVGIIEADYRISSVEGFRFRALLFLAISVAIAGAAALLVSAYVSANLVKPIKEMKRMTDALAQKDFSEGIAVIRKDELGQMQRSMITTRDNLKEALGSLQEERNQIAAMKDNLRTGVFLMDMNFIIQEQYSASMEKVFGLTDLAGKTFTNLLSASYSDSELTTIQDFFTMVISGSMKQKKIDNMNPLNEFSYTNPETKEVKTLRCGFARIKRENYTVFVLGTAEDVTAEAKLKKRLKDEEKIRHEEMRALFEIVNIDPSILGSFLPDAEYNFNKILELLRDDKRSSRDVFVDIYQLVHATKSDAAIIGLGFFADKLHELENEIKTITRKDKIDFSEMLKFTVNTERVLQEKDKIIETIAKLNTERKIEVGENKDVFLLVESLKRAAVRVAGDTNKEIIFESEAIDNEALSKVPRRELKDALVQVVRNAVYHGIETPDERVLCGKTKEGHITLSITAEDGMLHAALSDDGRGLDFAKIRGKALQKGLITAEEAADNKKVLGVIFAPEFSTAESEDIHAGRGIGLNLVRDRVKDLGGSLKVNSKHEKGTTFHIYIPLGNI